jgi:hypothetical protein
MSPLKKGPNIKKTFKKKKERKEKETIFTRLTKLIFSDINQVTCFGFEQAIIKLCVESRKMKVYNCNRYDSR